MGDALQKVQATARRVKVFPLPSVVLLPHGAAPLHIFEERYREMVKDALATDGVFAMAQVTPGQERQLLGKPSLEPMLCVGIITASERLEDGRYNLVLVGVARARLIRELETNHLYRELEVEVVADDETPTPDDDLLREAVLELIARVPQDAAEMLSQVLSTLSGGPLADALAGAVLGDQTRRLELLNELDAARRVREVADDLLAIAGRLPRNKPTSGYLN